MRFPLAAFCMVSTMQGWAADSVVLNGGPVQMRREAVVAPLPVYPATTSAAGRQGLVVIRVNVRAGGAVAGTEMIESFDDDAARSVIETVKRWRFQPTKKDGVADNATRIGKLLFRFVIQDGVPRVLDLPATAPESMSKPKRLHP